ncbi:MAB_1171c family putative transporter [Actinoplanes sp. NPDC051475]|uniref:MAB_1171c family putative transporter n=1 Tax=Actinoplanes sp. NPDC051475 TaxID=3157225 RepID=UPI00344D130A
MNGVLTGALLTLLWATVLVRFPTLWRDAQQRAIWATLCTLALAKTIATPGVNAQLRDVATQPQVIPHLIGVATAFFLLRFISLITDYYSSRPRAARYQLLLAVVVAAVLLTLIMITPGGIKTKGTDLMSTATAPSAAAYWVTLNGYLGTVLAIAGVLFWRVSRSASAGLLRNGLRVITVGTLIMAVYATLKTALIVVHAFGVTIDVEPIEPTANGLRTTGTILAVIGAAVPATGKIRSIVRSYRSLWALRPLWRVIRRTFPEIILFSRRRALVELAGLDDVHLRLYRRVIEIRDGMLALRDYLPADALDDARTFLANPVITPESAASGADAALIKDDGNPTTAPKSAHFVAALVQACGDPSTASKSAASDAALIEACGIALALQRHRAGAPAATSGRWSDMSTSPGSGSEPSDERALTDEVSWLSAVSAAFRRKEPRRFAGHACASARGDPSDHIAGQ